MSAMSCQGRLRVRSKKQGFNRSTGACYRYALVQPLPRAQADYWREGHRHVQEAAVSALDMCGMQRPTHTLKGVRHGINTGVESKA